MAELPDLTLEPSIKYLRDSIVLMRKLLSKQIFNSKRANNKGAPVTPLTEKNQLKCLIYVNEQYDGWKEECLRILQSKFDAETHTFAPENEILEALQRSAIVQALNFQNPLKFCRPFLSFKKDEAIAHGVQALDLKLPFGEMEVLQENLDLIKMELGVEHVEVLSAIDLDDLAKAGPLVSLLNQSPPSPGYPTPVFLSR
ncbi:hypothetical protein L1049_017541 [Liquidambar formosana]|uniref:Uncharacterized protein n=1 Tax=Liquidambar formosana TaxID=63359 RepID=A0AAP0S7Y6_LIQFO